MAEQQFCHLGHKIVECFRKRPDDIFKIDAATGQSETNASALSRSIRLATSLTALGLAPGDVLALSGRNHLDISIPYFAALFNGLPMLGVDPFFRLDEIKHVFKLTSPKVAFCDPEAYDNYVKAAQELEMDTKVFTFGDGPNSMKALIEEHGKNIKEEDFRLPEFDLKKVYVWLICTSGSTGNSKVAAFTHTSCLKKSLGYMHAAQQSNKPVSKFGMILSPVQWVSGIFFRVTMPLMGQTIVQTSAPLTVDHVVEIINKYRPVTCMFGPSLMSGILAYEPPCDLTSFDLILLAGSKVPDGLVEKLQSRMHKNAKALDMYGQTETMGPAIFGSPDTPAKSCGAPLPFYQVQLVDPETEAVIREPNTPGELWVKGELIFTEYINNPEETAKAFSKDGWFKTGDLMYRDERDNYYYVSRIKTLIKYQNYHVVPGELEDVIRLHPGVSDVAVLGLPDQIDGEHPVACVVRKQGCDVTAQEIKDLVAKKLSEKKQLRGGVVFLEKLPVLSTGKVSLKDLRRIVETLNKE
ncbi:hypothetical protein ABMA27_008586 [Loxostege sticticalis]|uniref:Luciferin 4-monooxygenase n=1 Tax=Loxostege sticticalis TaxID=481309 RepID=A0ABR3HBW0_LOXSC